MKRFGSYENGFTLTFDNGLVLSTRFGFMNYCENKGTDPPPKNVGPLLSEDCEVAVWDSSATGFDVEDSPNRDWVTGWQQAVFNEEPYDDVRGHVSFLDWLKIVEWCEQKEKA